MLKDILRDAAPLLGVILPAIGAFFIYRKAERKREREMEDAQKVPLRMQADLTATATGPNLIADAIGLLTVEVIAFCKMAAERYEKDRRQRQEFLEEVVRLREHMGRIRKHLEDGGEGR